VAYGPGTTAYGLGGTTTYPYGDGATAYGPGIVGATVIPNATPACALDGVNATNTQANATKASIDRFSIFLPPRSPLTP
jgi:hypothetical protein